MSEPKDYCVMIIPVDEDPYVAVWHVDPPTSPKHYLSLKAHVEQITGPPWEHVNVFADFHGGQEFKYLDMFVNEVGRLNDILPVNPVATAIYQNNLRCHDPEELEKVLAKGDGWIAGPAVLFEDKVWL